MANKKEKIKVLFIAKNIPVPKRSSNRIIFDIALHLSEYYSIKFLFPKELVPYWLRNNPRFAYLYKLKKWISEGFRIIPVSYIKLPFKHFQYWALCYLPGKAKKLVAEGNPDLVHAHYLFPDGYIAYRIFKRLNIPYVLTFRNQDKQYLELISVNNPDYQKAKKIITHAIAVLTPNGGYKEFVESRFDVHCQIVPHGIEKEVFEDYQKKEEQEYLSLITVADTLSTKNIDWVVKAFMAYNGDKEIKLKLVGSVCSREDIKALCQGDKRIQLLGKIKRSEVLHLMRKSDVFVLPSSKETFGLVYLEAAATRNALVGFKGEGVWGVFEENEEMLFCSDYDEFEKQLHQLLNDSKLRDKLANNAFNKAETMEWEKVKTFYRNIYNNSLS